MKQFYIKCVIIIERDEIMELINLKGNTYILEDFNRIGLYVYNNNDVVIIDTGLNDESGKTIIEACETKGWTIKMIINTHSHPDHIGGNNYIVNKLGVPVYTYGVEEALANNPELGTAIINGGYPHKFIRMAFGRPKVKTLPLTEEILPKGLEFYCLPGHNSDMIGIKTDDGVHFLADGITGENLITKYQLQFMYDIKTYLKTLDYIGELEGDFFVPSHGAITEDIKSLSELNKKIIGEVTLKIKEICYEGLSFDDILKELTDLYHIKLEFAQYSMISFTLRCYLSYMLDEKILETEFINNKLIWKTM